MRIFTEILREELANGHSYMYCPRERGTLYPLDSYHEMMRILNNDILLKAFYKQYDSIDTSLLEDLIKSRTQHSLSLSFLVKNDSMVGTILALIHTIFDEKAIYVIRQSLDIGVPPEQFSSLRQALLVHNRKDDLILALKQDYWLTQKLIKKTTEQYSEKYRE